MVAFRGTHDISVRLYGRRNTFLSFFVKSSWETSKLDSKSSIIWGLSDDFLSPKISSHASKSFIKHSERFLRVRGTYRYQLEYYVRIRSISNSLLSLCTKIWPENDDISSIFLSNSVIFDKSVNFKPPENFSKSSN